MALLYTAGLFILEYDSDASTSFYEVTMPTPFFTMNDLQKNIFTVIDQGITGPASFLRLNELIT